MVACLHYGYSNCIRRTLLQSFLGNDKMEARFLLHFVSALKLENLK